MRPRNGRKPTHEPHREAKETGEDTEHGRQQMVKDASAVCWSFAGMPHSRDTLGSWQITVVRSNSTLTTLATTIPRPVGG